MKNAFAGWAYHSPDQVIGHLTSAPDTPAAVVRKVAEVLGNDDPFLNLERAGSLPGNLAGEYFEAVMQEWAQSSPQAATEFAARIEDQTMRDLALGSAGAT